MNNESIPEAWPVHENEEASSFEAFDPDSYNAWDDYEDCYYDMEEQQLQRMADQMLQRGVEL